tara:strand:+ start:476 stop:811 length:336 start_codon:yes stop_codon:yes gene_type:complete
MGRAEAIAKKTYHSMLVHKDIYKKQLEKSGSLVVTQLKNPYRQIADDASVEEIEAWLRSNTPPGRLDSLVQTGVKRIRDNRLKKLYVVCFGGKHRSAVVARLINAQLGSGA